MLEVRDLQVTFRAGSGLFAGLAGRKGDAARAVDGVNLSVARARCSRSPASRGAARPRSPGPIMGLVPPTRARSCSRAGAARRTALRAYRRKVQMVFQDPTGALNPRQTIYESVAEGLRIHGSTTATARRGGARRTALSRAGLRPPERFFLLYPHELSGGHASGW